MSTTGISLLQSHEQGIAWCTPHHCHAMHSPADAIRGGVYVSPRRARGNATRRPAFGVATGHRSHKATMPQASPVPVVMQPGCCQGSMFHPDRG